MAMKNKVSKAAFERLSDEAKDHYRAEGEEYVLEVEGAEDTGALNRALIREKARAKNFETRNNELEVEIESLSGADKNKRSDIKAIEAEWKAKLEDTTATLTGTITKLKAHTSATLVDGVANQIASAISTAPKILAPHIKARLVADFEGDSPVTKILDKDGKVSAMTVDQLQQELVANKDFSAIIRGSGASGGAGGGKGNGGAVNFQANQNSEKPANLASMSAKELAAHVTAKKAAEQGE